MIEETVSSFEEDQKKMIDIHTEERILYWADKLGCTRTDLLYAVLNVGHSYKSVEAFLCMNHRKQMSTRPR